jgi:hypothetical protein
MQHNALLPGRPRRQGGDCRRYAGAAVVRPHRRPERASRSRHRSQYQLGPYRPYDPYDPYDPYALWPWERRICQDEEKR